MKTHLSSIGNRICGRFYSDKIRQSITNRKSRISTHNYQIKTLLGISSVTGLCAGMAFYTINVPSVDQSIEVSPSNLQIDDCGKDIVSEFPCNSVKNTFPLNNQDCQGNSLSTAIAKSKECMLEVSRNSGAPGMSICVSVQGNMVWSAGFGYADVEQMVPCKGNTVMRIASISKPITMAAVAKLIDQKKIDIEEPVQTYMPKYPTAIYKGKQVIMKVKHILSNTSGIRHYSLWHEKVKSFKEIPEMAKIEDNQLSSEERVKLKKKHIQDYLSKLHTIHANATQKKDQFNLEEFFLKENFSRVEEVLPLFQDDDLFCEPGTSFHYSTHGWTLVSAVIEGAIGKKFETVMDQMLKEIGLSSTHFEKNDAIIKGRARQYVRLEGGRLRNAPYVNNSCKYAGGGLLSNTDDLVKFGNIMLYSYQNSNNTTIPKGYIQKSTMKKMWSPSPGTETDSYKSRYGLGWFVLSDELAAGMCDNRPLTIYHTGASIGGSSVLLIRPDKIEDENFNHLPKGVVVAILTNLEGVNVLPAARTISNYFLEVNVVGRVGTSKQNVYSVNG